MASASAASAPAPFAVDLELKKAFQDLQMQVMTTREKVRQMQSEIDSSKRTTVGMRITQKTLEGLQSKEHRTYEAVGRIFVLKDRDQIQSKLLATIGEYEEKVKSLEKNKLYHETKVKESENNLRELINQKKNAAK